MNLTKKHLVAFFKQQERSVPFTQLEREFGGRHIKRELKRILEDMIEDGERSGNGETAIACREKYRAYVAEFPYIGMATDLSPPLPAVKTFSFRQNF